MRNTIKTKLWYKKIIKDWTSPSPRNYVWFKILDLGFSGILVAVKHGQSSSSFKFPCRPLPPALITHFCLSDWMAAVFKTEYSNQALLFTNSWLISGWIISVCALLYDSSDWLINILFCRRIMFLFFMFVWKEKRPGSLDPSVVDPSFVLLSQSVSSVMLYHVQHTTVVGF